MWNSKYKKKFLVFQVILVLNSGIIRFIHVRYKGNEKTDVHMYVQRNITPA